VEMVVADQLVVTQVGVSICTSRVQCLVVDGAVFPIAALEDGFFSVEDVSNVEGGTGQIALGDVYTVVVRLCSVVADPHDAWMVVTGIQGRKPRLVVWLWTGVSSGNRPTNIIETRKIPRASLEG